MKHNIRKTVYSWNGEMKRVVEEIDCELGSGILDKNGREIFEGNKVKALTPNGDYEIGTVIFDTGTFMWESDRWTTELDSGGIYELEIVDD